MEFTREYEKARKELQVEEKRLLLDAEITLAQKGPYFYRRRNRMTVTYIPEDHNEISKPCNYIKHRLYPKVMKELKKNNTRIFEDYFSENYSTFYDDRKKYEPVRFTQKYAAMIKKSKRIF